MATFQASITDVGKALLARTTQGSPAPLNFIAFGSGNRVPDGTETALQNPIAGKKLPLRAGRVQGTRFSFLAEDLDFDPNAVGTDYDVHEMGVFSDNTLVAYFSKESGAIITKPNNAALRFPVAGEFSEAMPGNVSFAVSFASPTKASKAQAEKDKATESENYMTPLLTQNFYDVRKALDTDVQAGSDDNRFVTSLKLKNWWTKLDISTKLLDARPFASMAQAVAGTASTVVMSPLRVAQYVTARLATKAQAEAGTDNVDLMTPLRTQEHFNHHVRAYQDGSLPATVPPNDTIEIVYEA